MTHFPNQNNLLKRIKYIEGNHSELFSTQHAQSDNFITTRHYDKNCDASKSFTIDARNQFQPLENVIEEQSSNNELNMTRETSNSPGNNSIKTAKKSGEKLPSSTDPTDNNFILTDVNNCINILKKSKRRTLKKYGKNLSYL